MSTNREKILTILAGILKNKGAELPAVTDETELYQGGIGLDSMDTAEFSALLEAEFGRDPYSQEKFPRTLGDAVSFYPQSAGAE